MNQLTIVSGAASQASLGRTILDRWPRPDERPLLCESTLETLLRGSLQHATALVPLRNPGIISIPLSFVVGIVVSLAAPEDAAAAKFAATERQLHLGEEV